MTTQKVLLFCCLVLISMNHLQGFFIPPKTPPLSKNCRKEIVEEVQGSHEAEIQPMSFYHKIIKSFLIRQMIEKLSEKGLSFKEKRNSI